MKMQKDKNKEGDLEEQLSGRTLIARSIITWEKLKHWDDGKRTGK